MKSQIESRYRFKLRELRQRRKISGAELARQCGVTRSYIYLLEKGEQLPSCWVLLRLREVLEIGFQSFFELKREENIKN